MNPMEVNSVKDEIGSRLNSEEWSRHIAGRVISKRRKIIKRRILTSTMMIMVAAVSLTITIGFNDKRPAEFNTFVKAQVDGTYTSVFNYAKNVNSRSVDEVMYEDIDRLVDNTLAMR